VEIGPAASREILLIEDDRDVRETLAEVLQEEGYLVSMAKTGADALQQLGARQKLPAAILLDLMMPVMNGWDFWSVQQRNLAWAAIPVVVISADTNAKDKSTSLHPIACLRKPLDIDELLAILARLMGERISAEGGIEKDS
jgi:DNA-binding response OmpR family regulator